MYRLCHLEKRKCLKICAKKGTSIATRVIMKRLFITLLFLPLISNAYSIQSCEGTNAQKTVQVYKQATYKVAKFLSDEGLKTLEDYAVILKRKIDTNNKELVKSLFEKYARKEGFNTFIKDLASFNYYNKKKRLSNMEATIIVTLMNQIENLKLTKIEMDSIWFHQLVTDIVEKNHGKYSLHYNNYNFSNLVMKLTGGNAYTEALNKSNYSIIECIYPDTLNLRDKYWDILSEEEKLTVKGKEVFFYDRLVTSPVLTIPLPKIMNGKNKIRPLRESFTGEYNFDEYWKYLKNINIKSSKEIILSFHQKYGNEEFYVIDKSNQKLLHYDQTANEISDEIIKIQMDDRMNTGGAGIYFSSKKGISGSKDNIIRHYDFNNKIEPGYRVYILPSDDESNRFQIKNYKLGFYSLKKRLHYNAYNFTNRDNKEIKTTIRLKIKDDYLQRYLQALADEKKTLMSLYNMDSETYNNLIKFVFGVLSPESSMAFHNPFNKPKSFLKYHLKEALPYFVSLSKGDGFDTSNNSAGVTQMKKVPQLIKDHYNINKVHLQLPREAAIATMGFAYRILLELKAISSKHPSINRFNIYDYLYYIYNGKRHEIKNATATPDKNKTIIQIMEASLLITIIDEINPND